MSFRGLFGPKTPPIPKPEPALPPLEGPYASVLRALKASGVEARILVQVAEREGAAPAVLAALVLHYFQWLGHNVYQGKGIPDPEALLEAATGLFANPAPVVAELLGDRTAAARFRLLIRDPDAPALAALRLQLDLPRDLDRALGPSCIEITGPVDTLDLKFLLQEADCDLRVEGPVGCLSLPKGWQPREQVRLSRAGGLRNLSLGGFRSRSGTLELADCPDLRVLRVGFGLTRVLVRNCPKLERVSLQSTSIRSLDLIDLPLLQQLDLARPSTPADSPDLRLQDCPALASLLPQGRHVRTVRSLSLVGCRLIAGLPPNLHIQKDLVIGDCPALDPDPLGRQVRGRTTVLPPRNESG
jgi:hypothetical protein